MPTYKRALYRSKTRGVGESERWHYKLGKQNVSSAATRGEEGEKKKKMREKKRKRCKRQNSQGDFEEKKRRKESTEGRRTEREHTRAAGALPATAIRQPPVAAPRRSPRPVPARTRRHARPGRAPRALRGSPRPCAWLCV